MKVLVLLLLLTLTAACSAPPSSIQAITPLPSQSLTTSTAAPDVAPTTVAAAPMPTSALAALIASAPTATPQPLETNLPQGSARAIALATDTALTWPESSSAPANSAPIPLTFDEFYSGYDLRTGLILSDTLLALDGQKVVIEGYMAPPLKPELDYFVLTRIRLAFCPFCSNASDWPDDIALVYMPDDATTTATNAPVRVTGRIEIGTSVDQETGMVSLVRVYVDRFELLG